MKFFAATVAFSLLGATMAAPSPLNRRLKVDGVLACLDPVVALAVNELKSLEQTQIEKLIHNILNGQEIKSELESVGNVTHGVTELLSCLSVGLSDVDAQLGDTVISLLETLHLVPSA
ncbi:hypothetical protein BGW36DRAFT_378634 [Talaromyces proteolyticus]|uniref:Uncharacterized protein n=1 Tax=Talaromyces proteolyticus TaxID=1131652 RepID=A0AAD4KW54_9EURO|nr:uncharacterized protein BGW36DRAFT_378634 [Talaromyces proteolyticus]KAH8697404.1 hypothetical protein BGW36DRAFT_378634 [Talaromyces proteolyticus]